MKTWLIYKHTLLIGEHTGWSYIGLTMQKLGKRWQNGLGYKDCIFANAIKKYGWENFSHEILKENILSIDEANYWEKYYIKKYHTWIYDQNCRGYNTTSGGDGTIGHQCPESAKQKISKANRGKHYSIATEFENRAVYCLELDQIFKTVQEAARQTGAKASNITYCCKKLRKTANNYHWCYVEEKNNFKLEANVKGKRKKVYCIELNIIFKTAIEAERNLHVDRHFISACCRNIIETAGNYHWKYIEEQ